MLRNIPILRGTLAAGVAASLLACSSVTDTLLEAEDPDIIQPSTVSTPEAADATRIACETVPITVQENDTLSSIAANYAVIEEILAKVQQIRSAAEHPRRNDGGAGCDVD